MIGIWLDRLAHWLRDNDWLRERRKQEIMARRSAQHISRRTRTEHAMVAALRHDRGEGEKAP